ncbi:MAG: glycosyltransferase family 4 protein [Bacteroidales bacterium]|nr:glycosyltransferase family 4 protein [Bacteroidales bacterium]
MTYLIILALLVLAELLYFRIADHFNIIDKPNERSSHSSIVLRGGGVIFSLSMIAWMLLMCINGENSIVLEYLPFLIGLMLVAGVSFWDDVKSLPDSIRLVVQFSAMALMFWSMGIMHWNMWWIVILASIVCVGATNVINFMDGINGITAGYALAVLLPLALLNKDLAFIDSSFLVVAIIGVLVFCIFNFRPKGKAKCFAGDVGSISIAFIMLYAIGRLVVQTQDITYLIFLLVYGIDGCLTIVHRIMLHENLGEAHRKHAYQLMANELKIGHVKVSSLYMLLQLAVSLGFIYLCPDSMAAHWGYLVGVALVLAVAYVLFKKKYYHLHEEYLAGLKKS